MAPQEHAGRTASRGAFRSGTEGRYDGGMRKPSLTLETFVTALAVLGAGTSIGCSKAERATAAPETPAANAPAPPPPAVGAPAEGALPLAAPPAQPAPPAPTAPEPESAKKKPEDTAAKGGAGSVRGTVAPAPKPGSSAKSPSASCGAGGCTPDMKKGN
jgi:hypothetical protein